jgi:VanZ family protein
MKIPGFLFGRKYLRGFAIVWAMLIFTVSSIPNLPNPELPENDFLSLRLDYLFHFAVFFILSVAMVLWQIPASFKFKPSGLTRIMTIGTAFAIIDEVHQLIIPGRSFNPIDMVFNLAGFWAGAFLFYFYFIRILMGKNERFPGIRKMLEIRE